MYFAVLGALTILSNSLAVAGYTAGPFAYLAPFEHALRFLPVNSSSGIVLVILQMGRKALTFQYFVEPILSF